MKKKTKEPRQGKASVVRKFIRCGDISCHCNVGQGHGPYDYLQWREGETVRSEYLGRSQGD